MCLPCRPVIAAASFCGYHERWNSATPPVCNDLNKVYAIRLINMPFAALDLPSLALTQLRSVVEADHGDRVHVQLLYANQDFAVDPGIELYQQIAASVPLGMTGIGDWVFRAAAFPDAPDNSREYFARCFPSSDEATRRLKHAALRVRDGVNSWIDGYIDRHQLEHVDLVGLTSMFAQNLACMALSRRLKERNSRITIVVGGANCEFPMGRELAQKSPMFDFVFSGPSLASFSEFVRHRLEGNEDSCHRMAGVYSRQNVDRPSGDECGGEITGSGLPVVGPFGLERRLDDIVALDYREYLAGIARWKELHPILLFETSRGCWWGERAHCTFCGLNGLTMKYRAMPAETAVRQFASLFRYAATLPRLTLQCVDNIMPREYFGEVLPRLETPDNVEIFYEVKADLRESDVEALSRARVKRIQPGIEALSTSTLRLMKKGTTAFHGVLLLKRCLQYEITPEWNLLIGFPGESAEVYAKYQRDLPLLYHLPPPTGVFPVRFDRYSPYFAEAESYGLDLKPLDFYQLLYPFDDDALRRLAYFFFDNNFQSDYFVQMVQWIRPLSRLIDQWRRRFRGEGGGERAALVVEQSADAARLVDTRGGSRRIESISPLGLRILRLLEEPLDQLRLTAGLGAADGRCAEDELARLLHLGCLFEEQGRFVSLVVNPCQNASSSSSG